MIIKYTPEGAEPKDYEFVPSKLMSPEAEAIENVGGGSWDTFEEFGFRFLKGSIRAYRAALWVMMKRENPKLRFQDLVFSVSEVSVDYSKSELVRIKEALEKNDDDSMPEDQRISALASINTAIQDKEFESVTEDLKDPTENLKADTSTSAQPVSPQDSEN